MTFHFCCGKLPFSMKNMVQQRMSYRLCNKYILSNLKESKRNAHSAAKSVEMTVFNGSQSTSKCRPTGSPSKCQHMGSQFRGTNSAGALTSLQCLRTGAVYLESAAGCGKLSFFQPYKFGRDENYLGLGLGFLLQPAAAGGHHVVDCSLSSNSTSTHYQQLRKYTTLTDGTKTVFSSKSVEGSLLQANVLNVEIPKRFKARSRQGRAKKEEDRQDEEEDTDDESDDEEDDDSDSEAVDNYLQEDRKFSNAFKDYTFYIKSLRVDAVVGAGLNISRSKVEEQFLGSKLRLNGEKLVKKGAKMDPGDVADVVFSKADGKMEVKRVRLLYASGHQTSKDRTKVKIRAWRSLVSIDA